MSRKGEIPPGVEEQNFPAEALHDESSTSWQNELCSQVSFPDIGNLLYNFHHANLFWLWYYVTTEFHDMSMQLLFLVTS